MWFFPAALLAALVLAGVGAAIYNRIVRFANAVAASWSDVGVLLKKRHDLVDNIVQAVKGYAAHERATLTGVTDARARAASAAAPGEVSRAETALGRQLGGLLAVSEGYPDLKASAGFLELQRQVRELEDQIEARRRVYNAAVRDYNTLIETFPPNLVAATFGFSRSEFFEPPPSAEASVPRVSFEP